MKMQELTFMSLREIADESNESLCTGCTDEACVCTILFSQLKDTVNDVLSNDDFATQIRMASKSIRAYCMDHLIDTPPEIIEISRMRRRSLIACQALNQFTAADILQWSGDIKMKLYLFCGDQRVSHQ